MVPGGPFAETREVLGGFSVLDAPDLDTALRLARLCPEEVVEVRDRPGCRDPTPTRPG